MFGHDASNNCHSHISEETKVEAAVVSAVKVSMEFPLPTPRSTTGSCGGALLFLDTLWSAPQKQLELKLFFLCDVILNLVSVYRLALQKLVLGNRGNGNGQCRGRNRPVVMGTP